MVSHDLKYLFYIQLFFLMLIFMGCNPSTKVATGSYAGRVVLTNDTGDPSLDPADYSGVTVALYKLAEKDTTISRINKKYPALGILIDQETEFDHRDQNALFITQTQNNGSFTISSQAIGQYNLVIYKEGWGVRYVYSIEIDDSKTNSYSSIEESIVLYPETHLPYVIMEDFTIKNNHTYIASDDIVFLGDVSIENGSNILIDQGRRIDFHGGFITPENGDRWRIDTLDGYYENHYVPHINRKHFQKIMFSSTDNVELRNGIISSCDDGVFKTAGAMSVENMLFQNGVTAFVFSGEQASFHNNIVKNFNDRTCNFYGDAEIANNIMINNYDNLIIHEETFNVYNNYIAYNWVGIRPIYGSTHIYNNDFVENDYAISTMASSPLIDYNNFHGSIKYCLQTQGNYVQNYLDYGDPVVHENNFLSKDKIIISIKPDHHPGYNASSLVGVEKDLDATNNYWISSRVDDLLFDCEDSDDIAYKIVYIPKRSSKIQTAGING